MLWFKHTIGFLLNKIEEVDGQKPEYDSDQLIMKVASMVENPKELSLERYMSLKLHDFTENVTTVDPQELLGLAPEVQPFQENPDEIQQPNNNGNEAQNEAMI